jgi:hypothetical protein
MAVVTNKQIGINARRQTTQGRFYSIHSDRPPYPSVTTVLSIINKPAIAPWMAKMEREACIDAAFEQYMSGSDALMAKRYEYDTAPVDTNERVNASDALKALFKSELSAIIGRQKAGTKALEAAGEIGTQIHGKIEWRIRRDMGVTVGPEPKVCDPAEWGYMAFEDWAKKVSLKPIRIEHVLFSDQHQYAGTMDLLAWVTDENGIAHRTLIDFKSGKAIYAEAYLQTAAYAHALEEMGLEHPEQGMIVRLPKNMDDPEFEVADVPDLEGNFKAFLAALELWRWQQVQEAEYKAKVDRIKEEKAS